MVSCIRGKYIYMYRYSAAVCIGLYTRYQCIFYLGTCIFVHGLLLLYNMHIYICVTTAVSVCRTMVVSWPSQPGKVANPARG